jgi:hypothetical protein
MAGESLDGWHRGRKRRPTPYEYPIRASRYESIHQFFRRCEVNLANRVAHRLGGIAARIVDVNVESVLMRRMPRTAVGHAELATGGKRKVAHQNSWRGWVRITVLRKYTDGSTHGVESSPTTPLLISDSQQAGIPRQIGITGFGKWYSVNQASTRRQTNRNRSCGRSRWRSRRGRRSSRRCRGESGGRSYR